MIAAGLIFAGLAALLHVYIFVMESLTWTTPRTRAMFGTTAEEAETTKLLAFNQGFYNLFLAIVTAVGIAADRAGAPKLSVPRWCSPVSAPCWPPRWCCWPSSPDKARAAVTQGAFPLIAVALLVIALV